MKKYSLESLNDVVYFYINNQIQIYYKNNEIFLKNNTLHELETLF